MSFSANYDFTLNTNDLIEEAYSLAGISDVRESLTAEETFDATRSLNIVMKNLSIQGHRVFLFEDFVAFPKIGRSSLIFGSGGDDFSRAKDLRKTFSSAAVTAGDVVISVVNPEGFQAGGRVCLFNGTAFERLTIGGVSGNVISVNSPIAADYASGVSVFAYIPVNFKLLKLQEVALRYFDDSRLNMNRISQKEWASYSVPNAVGVPVQYFYRSNTMQTELFFYPKIQREDMYFEIIGTKAFDDMDAANNTPNIPSELYDPLIYALASRIALKYGFSSNSERLLAQSNAALPDIEAWDTTDTTVSFKSFEW